MVEAPRVVGVRSDSTPLEALRSRAEALGVGEPVDTESTPGGGTLPGVEIPSAGVRLSGDRRGPLRDRARPLIARVVDDHTVVDLRTVDPADDDEVAAALASVAGR